MLRRVVGRTLPYPKLSLLNFTRLSSIRMFANSTEQQQDQSHQYHHAHSKSNSKIKLRKELKNTSSSSSTSQHHTQKKDATKPFQHSRIGNFFQVQPEIGNQFSEDVVLQSYLKRKMPNDVQLPVFSDLEKFGDRIVEEIDALGRKCEEQQPTLQQYDAWGKRIDKILTSDGWTKMHNISAEEGLIAIAYERQFKELSRLYQIAKLYLFAPSSGLYSCPLAMTDGAARIIENVGDKSLMDHAYSRLTTRNPVKFWTSGQWMTERKGGSDVARGTETVAIPQLDGTYRLYGYKWFTSATDADIAITLARIVDDSGNVIEGSHGLSMFYLETRKPNGDLNNLEVQKLKNKLGTRQLPTAEMLLEGVPAIKISEEGRGVAAISTMLTLTRIHNTLSAVGCMRRMVNLARDYSTKRDAFGRTICQYPLHMQTLARMEVETRGCLLLMLELAWLLGCEECNVNSDKASMLLRILTPVAKLYTAKQAVKITSEGLECFGGQGYIEDTDLPRMLRDAQVLPIWEGTTSILSMDVLRSLAKTQGEALKIMFQDITEKTTQAERNNPSLKAECDTVDKATNSLAQFVIKHSNLLELGARDFAFSIAKTYIGALLLEHATSPYATDVDIETAKRWMQQDLTPVLTQHENLCYSNSTVTMDTKLVMDGYKGQPS